MKFIKLAYYINSGFRILSETKNKMSFIDLLRGKQWMISLNNGVSFQVSALLDCLILKETIYDDVYHLSYLRNPQCIIDVGAGFGDFSITASKRFPHCHIVAFEPHPELFKQFLINIHSNKCKNITPYQYALGKNQNTLLFSDHEPTQSSLFSRGLSQTKHRVQGKALDLFIKGTIDLLKIDCEGSELEVINSVSDRKLKHICMIALEYHNDVIAGIDKKIMTHLTKNKFICKILPDTFNQKIGYIYATH